MPDVLASLGAVPPPLGPLVELGRTRIGAAQGFANTLYRVYVTAAERETTVIVKRCDGGAWQREAAALTELGHDPALSVSVPAVLSSVGGEAGGEIVMEDLGDLEQRNPGDPHRAGAVPAIAGFLASLHGRSWSSFEPEPVGFGIWDAGRWQTRIGVAATRYPWVADRRTELAAWLPKANAAARRLGDVPCVRVHGDLHYDNLMWRTDGSVVVLDWESAATGPRVVDLAPFVFDRPDGDPAEIVAPYVAAVAESDEVAVSGLDEQLDDMIRVLVRGTIGWAGREDARHDHVRFEVSRAENARRAIAWMDRLD